MSWIILNKNKSLAHNLPFETLDDCEKFLSLLPYKEGEEFIIAKVTPKLEITVSRNFIATCI